MESDRGDEFTWTHVELEVEGWHGREKTTGPRQQLGVELGALAGAGVTVELGVGFGLVQSFGQLLLFGALVERDRVRADVFV